VSVIPEKVITQQAESILVKTVLFLGIIVAIILIIVGLFYAVKMQESKVHTTQLQKALKETDAANKVKGQFLMNMSHDVRTPLNTILGMTAIAQKESDDKEKMSECIKKIDIAGKHLLSLVNDVLDMSQIDSGKMILTEEVISLTQLFKKVADMMKIEAKEAKLTIDWTIQLKDEIIIGDSLRIQQVLINIINNAIKYTSEGGHVLLEMIQLEDKVKEGYGTYRFSCTDTGIGMRQDFLERIFLFFERDKNTTLSGVAGTGVGLAITKGILDLMGGSICVKSELNKGSTFTVDFHFKVQKQELQKEQDTIQDVIVDSNSQEQTQDYTNKRILLVEDVELNMEIAEELIGTTGVQIDKAYNGKEAVELFSKNPCGYYNLIFMDIQMPVMDGYEATSQIRSLDKPDSKSIPIVALSANALADDIENSLNAGMNEHIAKPIDMEAVWKVLKKYLNE
jgi:signal transduction histidine kinase/CheY-like chemotaxis protein